ncbi:Acyl-CoA-binding domain-containing protein 1 [Platanthera guangdongensis]|uniref:Acyl-CoA-binding domain-containing protein 1 n=1 Tax=Platanthera guangdongensis TaxID=2320717 RepID=A0ABR2MM04_9ASPA
MMDFYQELLLTAIFSLLIAFLISKIAVVGNGDGERREDASVSSDRPASAEKSEGPSPEEADASAVQSGIEEERLDTFYVAKEEGGSRGMIAGTDEFKVEVEVPDVAEIFRDGNDAIGKEEEEEEEEEKREVERPSVENMDAVLGRESEEGIEEEGSLLHWEDEWEGIEKSELEKLFSVATEYVVSSSGAVALAGLSSDVQMELYGLFKIATEGRCYESQPLPLNFSARTKWQAWQRLGNMAPEVAMEHYLNLLSKYIPGWAEVKSEEVAECAKGHDSPIAGLPDSGGPDLGLSFQSQLSSETRSKSEDLTHTQIDHTSEGSKILEQGLSGAFILNLLSPTRGAFLSIYW